MNISYFSLQHIEYGWIWRFVNLGKLWSPVTSAKITPNQTSWYVWTLDNASASLLVEAIRFPISPLTGDINPQISHWKNAKMTIAYNSAYDQTGTFTSPPQSHLERAESSTFMAGNGLTRCVCYCAMLTADESNHSATSTLHPHCTDGHTTTTYTTLNCSAD